MDEIAADPDALAFMTQFIAVTAASAGVSPDDVIITGFSTDGDDVPGCSANALGGSMEMDVTTAYLDSLIGDPTALDDCYLSMDEIAANPDALAFATQFIAVTAASAGVAPADVEFSGFSTDDDYVPGCSGTEGRRLQAATSAGQAACLPGGAFDDATCEAVPCVPTQIANSNRAGESNACTGSFGDTCVYVCDDGHADSGSGTIECLVGSIFSTTNCDANDCTSRLIPNSDRSSSACTGGTHATCPFTCDQGYAPSTAASELVCLATGEFDVEQTARRGQDACLPKACAPLLVPFSNRANRGCTGVTGETCVVTCEEGYKVLGMDPDTTCLPTGVFEARRCDPAIQVGGNAGWTTGGHLEPLLVGIGDTLHFEYATGTSNVAIVTTPNCDNVAAGTVLDSSGSFEYEPTVVGTIYFTSTVGTQCKYGQFIQVDVVKPSDLPPPPPIDDPSVGRPDTISYTHSVNWVTGEAVMHPDGGYYDRLGTAGLDWSCQKGHSAVSTLTLAYPTAGSYSVADHGVRPADESHPRSCANDVQAADRGPGVSRHDDGINMIVYPLNVTVYPLKTLMVERWTLMACLSTAALSSRQCR
jgi:hypothetical protein